MARKKFTEGEMNRLSASSYVLDVSPRVLHVPYYRRLSTRYRIVSFHFFTTFFMP